MEEKTPRGIFEIAYKAIQKYGNISMVSARTIERRHVLKSSMLNYYESTEEFEKCRYIKDFFENLEDDLKNGYDIEKEIGSDQSYIL